MSSFILRYVGHEPGDDGREILERFNCRQIDLSSSADDSNGEQIDELERLQVAERTFGPKVERSQSTE